MELWSRREKNNFETLSSCVAHVFTEFLIILCAFPDPFSKLAKKRSKYDKQRKKFKIYGIVAPVHRNTNVRLILTVCDDIFCMLPKHMIGDFSRVFREGHTNILTRKTGISASLTSSLSSSRRPLTVVASAPSSWLHCTTKPKNINTVAANILMIVQFVILLWRDFISVADP